MKLTFPYIIKFCFIGYLLKTLIVITPNMISNHLSLIGPYGEGIFSFIYYLQRFRPMKKWLEGKRDLKHLDIIEDGDVDIEIGQVLSSIKKVKVAEETGEEIMIDKSQGMRLQLKFLDKCYARCVEINEFFEKALWITSGALLQWIVSLAIYFIQLGIAILSLLECGTRRFKNILFFITLVISFFYIILTQNKERTELIFPKGNTRIPNLDEVFLNKIVIYPSHMTDWRWIFIYFLFIWIFLLAEALYFKYFPVKSERHRKKPNKPVINDISKIFQYCAQGKKDKLKDHIRKNSDIDVNATRDGNTLVHIAVSGGHKTILEYLIDNFKNDIDYSIRNNDGYNLLDLAVMKKNMQMINIILANTKPEVSSLILAVSNDQERTIKAIRANISSSIISSATLELDRLTCLLDELRQKNIKLERREQIKKNVDIFKQMILQKLKPTTCLPMDVIQNVDSEGKTSDLLLEFECPICSEEMVEPLQIFGCSNDHFLCSECLENPGLKSCPICREDFTVHKPTRRHAAEKLRQTLDL